MYEEKRTLIYNFKSNHFFDSFLGTYKEHGGLALTCSLLVVLLMDIRGDEGTVLEGSANRGQLDCLAGVSCVGDAVGGTAMPAIVKSVIGTVDRESGLGVYFAIDVDIVKALGVVFF
jgi:hypothetical protein